MHSNTAHTVSVLTIEGFKLFCAQIVGLILVSDNKYYYILLQKMNIIAFKRLLTHNAIKTDVSTTY